MTCRPITFKSTWLFRYFLNIIPIDDDIDDIIRIDDHIDDIIRIDYYIDHLMMIIVNIFLFVKINYKI